MASSAILTTTHLPQLRNVLAQWESKQAPIGPFKSTVDELKSRVNLGESKDKDVVVAFRTRPPLENEAEEKFSQTKEVASEEASSAAGNVAEGDSVSNGVQEEQQAFCSGISITSAEPGVFFAHVPGMKWSGPTLVHKKFEADLAFGPETDNEEVYQRLVVANDLLPLVLSGGIACVLAYGQTGTGKTFTMEGLEHRLARDLFDTAKVAGDRFRKSEQGRGGDPSTATAVEGTADDADPEDVYEFSVTFLELLGKHATDLVEPCTEFDEYGNPIRKEVVIQEDKAGNVNPRLIATAVRSSAELENIITEALSHRRTRATLRNATSSRSHAMLTIRVRNRLLPYAVEGQLLFVDLAGSERYEDSKDHSKQRMEESKENNVSLMNLKECVRAKAKMSEEDGFVHIPWRSNRLTVLLKPIFDIESRQPSKMVIVAHVSPHIQDSIHSANTLSYAAPFKTSPPKRRGPAPYDPKDPRTWNHEHTVSWLEEEFTKPTKSDVAKAKKLIADGAAPLRPLMVDLEKLCPPGCTASHYGKMYTNEFIEQCLQARLPVEGKRGMSTSVKVNTEALKNTAVEVIGKLFYLIMTAKTRTRNEIMKSRKKLTEEVYGEAPVAYIPGTTEERTVRHYDPIDLINAHIDLGNEMWDKYMADVRAKGEAEGKDWRELRVLYDKAEDELMAMWRELKIKEKSGDTANAQAN